MIVLDASAALELLLDTPLGVRIGDRVAGDGASLHAPHLLDVEVLHATRRLHLAGRLGDQRAAELITDLRSLPLERYPHEPLLDRAWALRASVTAYDAIYLALAEALEAPLLTCDARLGRSHGHDARIEVVSMVESSPRGPQEIT